MGKIKLAEKQPVLALEYFNETLSTLKTTGANKRLIVGKIYGDNKLVAVFEEMANAYLQLNQSEEAFSYLKLALFTGDKIRNEFTDNSTKERLQASLKHIAEKGIEICYQLQLQKKDQAILKSILALAEQTKARTLLDQINANQHQIASNNKDPLFTKKEKLERAIIYHEKQQLEEKEQAQNLVIDKLKFDLALVHKQIKKKYKQTNTDQEISVSLLLSKLPNVRAIEYFVGKNAVYLIDLQRGKVNAVHKIVNAQGLTAAIKHYADTYFNNGPSAMLNSPKDFYLASNHLYQSILPNIKFNKGEPLIIIPDEAIGYLSFDGLITHPIYSPDIANWPFLIRQNTVTYAFSLQTLFAPKVNRHQTNFVGLFSTHQNNASQPIQAVRDEANGIKQLLSGSYLMDEQVNVQSFQHAFENSSILHIATHSYLSGKNREPTLDFNPEQLFLFELSARKSAPSLVVLSACRTADGLLANGEGIVSLSRGFNAIGTPATVAGLWNVNDGAAATITSNFYRYLVEQQNGGQALHRSKLAWLNAPQSTTAFYLPYYWDSLIYIGVDQKFNLEPATNWWAIAGIGVVLMVIFSMMWLSRRLGN